MPVSLYSVFASLCCPPAKTVLSVVHVKQTDNGIAGLTICYVNARVAYFLCVFTVILPHFVVNRRDRGALLRFCGDQRALYHWQA